MFSKKVVSIVTTIAIATSLAGALFYTHRVSPEKQSGTIEIIPVHGHIHTGISSTATVLPQNRLEIRPPVNGRIEEILVKEGDAVSAGTIVGYMSSTERAALLDVARGQGDDALAYWKEIYKSIPLISPISGEVIVATTQPGQTVTTADGIVVISDKLIIRAHVDETDIGNIREGLAAIVTISAYPDTTIPARTAHIYYESQTINNVTLYAVDVIPNQSYTFFRSGMNASVDFIEKSNDDALLIPSESIQTDEGGAYVMVKEGSSSEKRYITTGLSDGNAVEITSGLTQDDTIIMKSSEYKVPYTNSGSNPFMPSRRKSSR